MILNDYLYPHYSNPSEHVSQTFVFYGIKVEYYGNFWVTLVDCHV